MASALVRVALAGVITTATRQTVKLWSYSFTIRSASGKIGIIIDLEFREL